MSWAVVAGLLQGIGLATQGGGLGAATHAASAQKKAVKAQWEEEFRQMTLEKNAAIGSQNAAYAASGVTVGVGSAKAVIDNSLDEYHRAVAAEAYLVRQRKKGIQAESKATRFAQVGGYFSSLASMANTYARATEKPPATTTTSGG
jgi:hypothetical protein